MLFLLFKLGNDRYALEAARVIEVIPLLELKRLPQAPAGVAGVLNYRGQPVPAVDLSQLTTGRPAAEQLSTRIVITSCPDAEGRPRLVGLIAEQATETLRCEPGDFVPAGINLKAAPYLGPVLMDGRGPIQWLHTHRLLTEPVRHQLFRESVSLAP